MADVVLLILLSALRSPAAKSHVAWRVFTTGDQSGFSYCPVLLVVTMLEKYIFEDLHNSKVERRRSNRITTLGLVLIAAWCRRCSERHTAIST